MRVAILCDMAEEEWPSMDLVGDMLSRGLEEQCCREIEVAKVRPSMQRRFTRWGGPSGRAARNADRLLNRFVDYPRWLGANRGRYDLFHLIDHSYSQLIHYLPRNRTVVTCHDLDTFRCLLEPEREKRPRWFRAMSRRILNGFQQASHVITVSAATRDGLLRHDLFPKERITVIPNGVDGVCTPEQNLLADSAAGRLLEGAEGKPLLLSVGSTLPRKRLDVLLRAFAAIKSEFPAARLIRVGGFTPDQADLAKNLGIEKEISMLQSLDRETLAAVYRRAWLLLHTAEAEGFGLPVIEAMACGCRVVASDLPVLREIGGAAASYCRVADVSDWRDMVCRLLSESFQQPAEWEARRQQGLARARYFSWDETARKTAAVYKRVLDPTS